VFIRCVLSTFFLNGSPLLASNPTASSIVFNVAQQKVVYKNSSLYLYNFNGLGTVEVYTIIGKKVAEFKNQTLDTAQFPLSLKDQNLYIIRVITNEGEVFTVKILAS
jgi:hypothetical protein